MGNNISQMPRQSARRSDIFALMVLRVGKADGQAEVRCYCIDKKGLMVMHNRDFRNRRPSYFCGRSGVMGAITFSRIARVALALLASLMITASPPSAKASSTSDHLGLSVTPGGILERNGMPYRGVGVNYYDVFLRTLRNPADDSYRDGFRKLAANHIPFVRFAAGGYYASDYRLYLQDKEAYFGRLDNVVHAAEEAKVGLIPSLFWVTYGVPDLVGEPRDQWGNSQSKIRQFMRTYTREVVSRYVHSPAIWGWEFGAEFDLAVDFPDPLRHLPPVNPHLGTPASRGSHDALTSEVFLDALSDFAKTVRAIDGERILLTGNGAPRPAAYHMHKERRYAGDTDQQFSTMLVYDNPGPYSPVCIHASPRTISRYFAARPVSFNELIGICVKAAHSASKSLYLEEFITGNPKAPVASTASRRQTVGEVLAAIQSNNVPLASPWVYDRKLVHDANNLSFEDDTSSILQMIGDFNRKWCPQYNGTASVAGTNR